MDHALLPPILEERTPQSFSSAQSCPHVCHRPGCRSSRHPFRGGPWALLPQLRAPHNELEVGGISPSMFNSLLFQPLALTTDTAMRRGP